MIVKVSSRLTVLNEILTLKLVTELLISTQPWLLHLNPLSLYTLTILKTIVIPYVSKVKWLNLLSLNI